jgi:threonine/homoserine/homoserine lactone efflux protein
MNVDIIEFIGTVILVTASGALAPGPLFFATLSHGSRTGARGGFIFSVSHTVVEFSLIMLFALGLLTVANEPFVKLVIGISGGIVLIIFGFFQIRNSFLTQQNQYRKKNESNRHLFFIGLLFTGLNPYFVLWWLTVGAQLIIISLEFASLLGVVFMYVCHVWMDYAWLTGIAYFSHKGTNVIGKRWYRALLGVFGGILIYFGITFLRPALGL